jgi:Rhodopirellula transposase DDE domain
VRLVLDGSEHADTLSQIERKPNAALTANTVSRVLALARHQQVEQNRAPTVFLHRSELAGKPLISYLVIVQLIASTTTDTGLTVACRLNESDYAKGIKVTDAEMAALNIKPAAFHSEWQEGQKCRHPPTFRLPC